MDSALEKLRKVLELERRMGCQDSAVIGGLEKFLSHWQRTAQAQGLDSQLVGDVCSLLTGYGSLDPDQQSGAIGKVLEMIGEKRAEPAATL